MPFHQIVSSTSTAILFCILYAIYLLLTINKQVAWDKRFRDKTGGTDSKAMTYMHAALVHVQAYYCHASLGSRIKIDWKYYWYYPNKSFLATSHTLNSLYSTTKSDLD